MSRICKYLVFTGLILLLGNSCATYKVHRDAEKPLQETISPQKPVHTVFLVGDSGEKNPGSVKNFQQLEKKLHAAGPNTTIVFLGDNIYPKGMPSKKDVEERAEAEEALDMQLEILRGFEGQAYFIAGNHDWKQGRPRGLKAVKRQDDYIEEVFDHDNVRFEPKPGCPGPEVVELTANLVLIMIDSQWWLQNWKNEKGINKGCEINNRLDFIAQLADAVKDHKDKQILLAMHHPLVSSGEHGGYYALHDHLFPLKHIADWLYLPLPVIGSIYPAYRSNFGNIQDIAHQKYSDLKSNIFHILDPYENMIIAAGHEHTLQYHTVNDHHFIVSGSGSKETALARTSTMRYGHGARGFVELEAYPDQSVLMKIWEQTEGPEAALMYEEKIINERIQISQDASMSGPVDFDKPTTAIISDIYDKSNFHRTLFGEQYRALYGIPVSAPKLNLEKEKLVPIKTGGGMQTNSLRLEKPSGRQYVLRGLNKDATRILPEAFQYTFAMEIVQDQFTASHPFAAFVIPPMADAAGIYHTNPKLVYLPAQPALGRYTEDFANALYLFEERPDEDWSDQKSFGFSRDIISTADVFERTQDEYRDQIDQPFTLRSRLFDMMIGDWDRHEDQWRFASFENDGGKIYRPIPRDRDQAFSSYEGFVIKLASLSSTELRKMNPFTEDIRQIQWFNLNNKAFDRYTLNALSKEQWLTTARSLQNAVTDATIASSLKMLPGPVYEKFGPEVIETIKGRKANLTAFAERYYHFLAKNVEIRGTHQRNTFEIDIRPNGEILVEVFDQDKEGDKKEKFYSRLFYPSETRRLSIYALDGDDKIVFTGAQRSRIRVDLVGGDGEDRYVVDGNIRKVKIYDDQVDTKKELPAALYYFVKDPEWMDYDPEAYRYNFGIPIFKVGFNPDDGLLIGGGIQRTQYGFKKEPFSSRHRFDAQYAIGSGALWASYSGEFVEAIRGFDFRIGALLQTQSFVHNYFGFGNESLRDDDLELDFNRVRKRNYALFPSLVKRLGAYQEFQINSAFQAIKIEKTSGRFISSPDNGLPESAFDEKIFGLISLAYRYRLVDNEIAPRRGIDFHLEGGFQSELQDLTAHRFFKGSLTLYYQFKTVLKPVLATRVGTEIHGGDFEFYQGAILGSRSNFRGIRLERYVGDKSFYHNTDLRFMLLRWRSYYLPAMMGFVLSFDHGRVWQRGEDSNVWHYAYGGGLWISPFQTLLLSLNYHVSDDDDRITFEMGFFF